MARIFPLPRKHSSGHLGLSVGWRPPEVSSRAASAASRLAEAPLLQVRTLFVSGLPLDIKPRELYLLFRPFKVPRDTGRRGAAAARWAREAGARPV